MEQKRRRMRCFNIEFTAEDEEYQRKVVAECHEYMKKLQAMGRPARMNGEYYTPGTAPKPPEWLPADEAVRYSGLSRRELVPLVASGKVRRRAYLKRGKRTYWEYCIQDLDNLQKDA